jgi:hypothetical protein
MKLICALDFFSVKNFLNHSSCEGLFVPFLLSLQCNLFLKKNWGVGKLKSKGELKCRIPTYPMKNQNIKKYVISANNNYSKHTL